MQFSGIVFFALFALVSLLHLYACARGLLPLRRASKVLLMPLLALAYGFCAAKPAFPVLLALLFGWLGDIFLIRPTVKVFQLSGIGSFIVGHVFYMAAMLRRLPGAALRLPWLSPLIALALAAFCFSRVLPVMDKKMRGAGCSYYLVLSALAAFAGVSLSAGISGALFSVLGALLFLCSDTLLCYQFFTVGSPAPKYDTAVMTTYLLAQTALVLGFLL